MSCFFTPESFKEELESFGNFKAGHVGSRVVSRTQTQL